MTARAVLITGATGKQGGAVVSALLKANADFEILALTRDVQSASAQRLAQKSPKIKLVAGDMDAADTIFRNAKVITKTPIWGVFSVQAAMGGGANPRKEEFQGKALIDASLKNGVKHMVYSSVDRGGARSDNDPTDVPHFVSKHNIEKHLQEKTQSGEMGWTILRPVAFFENLTPNFFGKVFATSWKINLKPDQKLQLVATSDIGFFAAEALRKPEEWKGKKLSLAGDELTYEQFAAVFKQKTGNDLPTTYHFVATLINWMSKELGSMFRWFRNVGYGADITSLRRMNPALKDFGTWLETDSQFKTRETSNNH
ncbi:nucleoside-diphosphate-sugar epimerase family protein [Daldinia caldariorum]|uniref:nucleoside-diphosphate-sugar epimerase family protein n=1 Tax=Daldinia caldariorum TaxID=326644 RepID=UPI002007ADC4|nr:nucleoside-diphosphate-sugar epimerase family protein [Daldinia caldariorum]KAI1472668.1 nucleoside-diphosphate-sugar epimerase family protein [Daldinia caldariorum]